MSKTKTRSRVVLVDQEIVELDEDGKRCTINLIFCPHCENTRHEKVVMAGFLWSVKPENINDSITFLRLQYKCAACGDLVDFSQTNLNKINKFSRINIDNCTFPPGTVNAIRNQVRGMIFQ